MTLRASEVVESAAVLAPLLEGARLQEVRVPGPGCVVLSLRRPGETVHLLLDAGTPSASFHTIERPPPNPRVALALQGLLRKELRGRLTALGVEGSGRALTLRFGEGDAARTVRWVGGRHGRIELLSMDRSGDGLGSDRGAPPGPSRGFGEAELRAHFEALRAGTELEDARRDLRRHLASRAKAARRLLAKRRVEAERGAHAAKLRAEGDLLQGAFHLLKRGLASIEVPDWHRGGEPVVVALDPALAPAEQVERLYRAARRATRAGEAAALRIPEAEARIDALTRALARLPEARSVDDVHDIRDGLPRELRPRVARAAAKSVESRARPWRTYVTGKGIRILAGRGARENDELTLRHANGNDVWLHVRGRPGAHVVVRGPGPSPSPELLRLAAQVAMAHSGVPDGEAADVAWTRAKYVQKKKGMAPGRVLVTQERVLHLRADRSALDGLERSAS